MRTAFLLTALAAVLSAQGAPGLDPAFFTRDPKAIMVACADKARAAQPRDSRMLAEFGRIYLAAGQRDRALDAFKRAEDLGRADAGTHALIARAWLHHGDKAAALASAKRMADLAPKTKTLLARAGVDFMKAGYAEDAAAFMERAYKVDNTDWRMTLDFGQAALKAGLPEAAAHWFRRTLTGRTDEEQVWKAVGLAYAEAAPS